MIPKKTEIIGTPGVYRRRRWDDLKRKVNRTTLSQRSNVRDEPRRARYLELSQDDTRAVGSIAGLGFVSASSKLVALTDPVVPIRHGNGRTRAGPTRLELRKWHSQAAVFPADHDEHLV